MFPFVGGSSVLVVGLISDRIGRHRLVIAVPLLAACGITLALIGSGAAMHNGRAGLALLAVVAFTLIGPYSLLAGALAVDFGGRRGSATAAGLIDTAGYLGAAASGVVVGSLAQHLGWSVVFRLQAAVAGASALACAAFWFRPPRTVAATVVTHSKEHAHAH